MRNERPQAQVTRTVLRQQIVAVLNAVYGGQFVVKRTKQKCVLVLVLLR